MRQLATVLCAVLFCATAFSAGPVLVITDGGYQVMTVGSDGKAVLSPVGQVVDLRGSPPPGGDVPTPPVATDPIAAQVKGWAAEVGDPAGAQALTMVYREVAKVAPGQSRELVISALRQASDAALGQTGGIEKWKPFRAKISGMIDQQEAAGSVDYVKLLNSIANGLESSAPGAALDPALLTLIINAIIQILRIFFPGGGGIGGV